MQDLFLSVRSVSQGFGILVLAFSVPETVKRAYKSQTAVNGCPGTGALAFQKIFG